MCNHKWNVSEYDDLSKLRIWFTLECDCCGKTFRVFQFKRRFLIRFLVKRPLIAFANFILRHVKDE